MRKIKTILTLLLVFAFGTIFTFSVYSKTVFSGDFENKPDMFFSPGDVNENGLLNSDDIRDMIVILLNSSVDDYNTVCSLFVNGKCSDVNGDEKVNIVDLVCLKKNIAGNLNLIENDIGKNHTKGMNLTGNTICSKDMKKELIANKKYTIKYSYKSTSPLIVKFSKSITNENTFTDSLSNDWKTVTHTFNTLSEIEDSSGYEFSIVGKGIVDDIFIYEVGSDNKISFVW